MARPFMAAYEGDVNAHQRRIKRRRIARAGMSLALRHRAMLAELDATSSMGPLFASMLRAAEWDSWAFVYALVRRNRSLGASP